VPPPQPVWSGVRLFRACASFGSTCRRSLPTGSVARIRAVAVLTETRRGDTPLRTVC